MYLPHFSDLNSNPLQQIKKKKKMFPVIHFRMRLIIEAHQHKLQIISMPLPRTFRVHKVKSTIKTPQAPHSDLRAALLRANILLHS